MLGDTGRAYGALGRALAGLGAASYALYLIHHFAIRLTGEVARHSPLDPAAWPWAYAAVALAVSIAAALVCYRAFERPVATAFWNLLARPSKAVPLRAQSPARP